jgi:hypothetical protein
MSSSSSSSSGSNVLLHKKDKEKPVNKVVKLSFLITYILLITTGTITFIEAIRTENPLIRHVMNLETCISIVAGYFYSTFIAAIDEYGKKGEPIDWKEITQTRYVDWAITTPMMLLTLCIFMSIHTKTPIHLGVISAIVALNYLMLSIGYLGEVGTVSRFMATVVGFVALFLVFAIVFFVFVQKSKGWACWLFLGIYSLIWSIYGLAYLMTEEYKNIVMNILDCTAKCFVGLGLWLYYVHILRV